MGEQVNRRGIPGVWHILASMRLGLVLMFLLAGAATLGVLLPKETAEQGQMLGRIIKALGLNQVFAARWFRGLAYLLAVNVLASFMSRLTAVLRVVRSPRMTLSSFDRLKCYESFYGKEKSEELTERIIQTLLANRYRVLQNQDDEQVQLYADKHRVALLGPVIAHLGLLVFFVGVMWVSASGFEGTITVPAGSIFKLSQLSPSNGNLNRDLSVQIDKNTQQILSPTGIREARGSLSIMDNGAVVKNGEIGFNLPVVYKDMSFHLINFDNGVLVSLNSAGKSNQYVIKPTKNKWPFRISDSEELYLVFSNVNANRTRPTVDYTIIQGGTIPVTLEQGHLNPGEIRNYQDVSFSLDEYIGTLMIRVTNRPGLWLVLSGALLLVFGMCISVFLRYRKIWVTLISEGDQTQVLAGGFSPKQRLRFASEFSALVEEIKG